MTVVLGVDVATADVRVVAADATGAVVATTHRPLPAPRRPRPGWSEQAPEYPRAVEEALAEVVAALAGRPIAGVAVTATSGTVVPCDARGVPVGAALMYDDRRRPSLDHPDAPALASVAWLARHRPAARYLHVNDVVNAFLAGTVVATDTSHALKTGADPATGRWRTAPLAAAGVDETALPPLGRPGAVVGEVHPSTGARTGLPAGTPIVAGMTDGCTGQIAAGAVAAGDTVGVLGTTLVLKGVSPTPLRGHDGAVYSHRGPDGDWWPGGASNVGAGALDAAFPGADLPALDAMAASHGPATVACYPLTAPGERFPFNDPAARAVWLGEPASPADRYRALLEGVAHAERLGVETLKAAGMPVDGPLRAVGGTSRSEVWLRIRATLHDRPVLVPTHPSSGFGAAVLAAAATVHNGLRPAVAAMVTSARTVEPDPRERAALDDSYHRLLAALRERGHNVVTPLPTTTPPAAERSPSRRH